MAELLIELFSEEIPARMQASAMTDFQRLVLKGLDDAGVEYGEATPHVTPRRIALCVNGIPAMRPDVREEKRGPKIGAPEQALAGFMRGNGIDDISTCEQRDGYYYAVIETKGGATADVLPKVIETAIRSLSWPKSMRWNQTDFRWVRPFHRVMALFDGAVVDGSLDMGGDWVVSYGAETSGHRFLSPDVFAVTDFADYRAKLKSANVLIDRAERMDMIKQASEKLATDHGYTLLDDPKLLEEVAGLVEWPLALMGSFDEEFLSVPQEALIASMRGHQKYFSVLDQDGKLTNKFVVIANMPDDQGNVVDGNERVLRARLADAKFFWDQDLKVSLDSHLPALENITFHEKLGKLSAKVERMRTLARTIAESMGADGAHADRAAQLCKADLVTQMVGEFPELQGLMGRYYALEAKEAPEVAGAISDHYSPAGPNDACPSEPVSVAVAMADKVDTIVGFFAIDEKPTGSKDPFALRRAALGIVRLILENDLDLSLNDVFETAAKLYDKPMSDDLMPFIADRLKVALKDQGVRHDVIDAVFSLGGQDNLRSLVARAKALQEFLETEDGQNLLTASRRAINIVQAEEKKDGRAYNAPVNDGALSEAEEKGLYDALSAARERISPALTSGEYQNAMVEMARLRQPVDAFFDRVTVNDNDPNIRENRLKLLSQIRETLDQVADFSKVVK